MTQEALKLALEALDNLMYWDNGKPDYDEAREAITAIKEALAQHDSVQAKPEPELCKYGQGPKLCTSSPMDCQCAIDAALAQPQQKPKCGAIIEVFGKDWRLEYMSLPVGKHKLYTQQYTYTTPPQRTWIGLTDDEQQQAYEQWQNDGWGVFYNAIEAKLKEKNT